MDIKVRGNNVIERLYARYMPAPFLSLLTDDCIARGKDYHAGGARYNTSYIQGVGVGTITDELSAIKKHVFEDKTISMSALLEMLTADFAGFERERQMLLNRTPRYGNDDDYADELMVRVFDAYFNAVDGRKNLRGGEYHINLLPTTCHVYFGSVTGATPDGRKAWTPLSEGVSPVQGADRLRTDRRSCARWPKWITSAPAAPCSTRNSRPRCSPTMKAWKNSSCWCAPISSSMDTTSNLT